MKKTFRRSLACLLAMLMIVFSVPFSALAMTPYEWDYEGYIEQGITNPDSEDDYFYGDTMTILEGHQFIFDSYHPALCFVVSQVGNSKLGDYTAVTNASNKHYTAVPYDEATILNPAQLKAGMRIAITVEVGGLDCLYSAAANCHYDPNYIVPGGYRAATNWASNNNYAITKGILTTGLYSEFIWGGAWDLEGNATWSGVTADNDYKSTFMGDIRENGNDTIQTKYGYAMGTMCFEVKQDCDLTKVLNIDNDLSSVTPYRMEDVKSTYPGHAYKFNPAGNTFGNPTLNIIWDNYSAGSTPDPEPTHEHNYDYANAVYTWNAANTACSAVATCTSTTGTCDAETVSATATNVSASADTADCTNGGQITYTATFASPFATQTKTVDTDAKGHTFTGDVAHYVDGTIDKHAATCIVCAAKDTDNGVACTMEKQDTSIEPTCTTGGNYVFKCSGCGYSVEQSQNATGIHINDYTDVAYTWADDNSTCTATIGCQTCDGTAATVTVDANRSGGSAANCQQTADTTYTATFADANLTTQTKTVTGAAGPHDYDYANAVYTWDGTTACSAVAKCKYCTATTTADATGVTSAEKTAATCTVKGTTTYTATFAAPFADQTKDAQDIATIDHDYDYANAVYTWDGTTACSAVAKCKYCTATTTADATGVTSAEKTAPTCQVMGTTTYTAAFAAPFAEQTKDVQDIATVDHNMVQTAPEIPATVDAPGKTAVKECSFECGTTEGGVEIPQLAHYVVTATAQNGTATVNDKATANIAPMGNVTLVATPASDDLVFVGWSLNDKIVSENPTYVTKAIADADYVAVFALAETNNASSTVVFTDEYSNVYDTQEVAYGEFATAPADPSFVGFTFAGWSVDGEIVDVATTAINENTTFVAVFERTATAQYTITVAEGCQINGEALTSKDFDYNDICTVTAPEGSVNGVWKVGDAVVGYGTSYTFFVGASATLTYVENESVAATPVVVAVSVERSEDATGVDFAFLATRTTPAGYTYVNAGFVYGKNMTDADLDLDNVGDKGSNGNSGIVKVVYCSTGVEQFRLTYGLSTKGSVASAKAFLAYTDGTGTHVIYGTFDAQTY